MSMRLSNYCAGIALYNCALSLIKRKKPLSVDKDPEPELLEDRISGKSKQEAVQTLKIMGGSSCKTESTSTSISYEDLLRYMRPNADIIRSIVSLNPRETSHFEDPKIDKSKKFHSKAEREMPLIKSKFQEEALLNKDVEAFEVFSKGTKFMKSINFSTVIIKLPAQTLYKSMVYYVIIEPRQQLLADGATEECVQIPGVLFSNPYGQKWTRFAELLPLCLFKSSNSVFFTPMLRKKRYRHIFRRGCSFKVKSLVPGRAFRRSGEHSWNKYDLRSKEMRNMLRGFIEQDIRQLSLLMTKTIIPLKPKTKRLSGLLKDEASGKRKLRTSEDVNTDKREIPNEIVSHKFQIFRRNYEPVKGNRQSPISTEYSNDALPTYIKSTWDIESTFELDSDGSVDELSKYRCVSGII